MKPNAKILLLSGYHFINSDRRVDLHFMTKAWLEMGHAVDFVAMRLSLLSWLNDKGRFAFAQSQPLNKWYDISSHLRQFIWMDFVHPLNLKNDFLNKMVAPLWHLKKHFLPAGIIKHLPTYDYIVIESGLPPLYFKALKKYAPQTKFIYHAADRLSSIHVHPAIEQELNNTVQDYDCVRILAEAMRSDFPEHLPLLYLPHGIDKEIFQQKKPSPYTALRNIVSVGDMLFDANILYFLARNLPECEFHLFGKKAIVPNAPVNIIHHGEQPFEKIVPYIQHATAGIAPYLAGNGADYLSQSSLKMIQYSYCGVPIIAPNFAKGSRENVFGYDASRSETILKAAQDALKSPQFAPVPASSWAEVAKKMLL